LPKFWDRYFFLGSLILLLYPSCRPAKTLVEGEYLLNKVFIHNQIKDIDEEELSPYLKQKPNTRMLGLARNRLYFYNIAYGIKRPKIKKIFMNSAEPPVIFDSLLTERSRKQLELFVHSKGYFNSTVSDSIVRSGDKKLNIHYYITSSKPYTIRNFNYSIEDPQVEQIVKRDTRTLSLIKPAEPYDMNILQRERERITKDLRNRGFYAFVKEYIYFQIDSNIKTDSSTSKHQLDILLGIKNPKTDSGEYRHERYYIDNIYIQTDYSFRDNVIRDTLKYEDYYFLNRTKLKYKPKAISQQIFYKKDDLFKIDKHTLTYNRLNNLNIFRSVSIRFDETNEDSSGNKQLDCFIELSPSPTNSYSVEIEGTHNTTNANGVAGSFVYKNKNLFRGAEIFEFKIKGAMQIQATSGEETDNTEILSVFNTLEYGPEISISFPKLLLPWNAGRISKSFNPKTSLTASYTYQKRVDYGRQMANLSLSYNWKQSEFTNHIVNFPSINYIKVDPASAILQDPDFQNNIILKSQFSDQFITNAKYTFIFNNQRLNKPGDFLYFRAGIEGAGNVLWAISKLSNSIPDELGQYQMLGINFAQYILPDIDLRYYKVFSQYNSLVYRIAMGVGLPYLNSFVLPFVKSFSAGGPNDIRAFKAYSIGPGAYHDADQNTLVGDIKLETNIEGRFDIYKYLEGALFIDAGNVWLMKEDGVKTFKFTGEDNFLNHIAVGAGVGLRLDFSFFILRLDAALPIRTPYLADGEKWIWHAFQNPPEDGNVWKTEVLNKINVNIGIGYPF
jgi:outer membrane translocation and assembly module TamA